MMPLSFCYVFLTLKTCSSSTNNWGKSSNFMFVLCAVTFEQRARWVASVQTAGHRSPLFQFLWVKYVYSPHSEVRQEEKNAKMSAAPLTRFWGYKNQKRLKAMANKGISLMGEGEHKWHFVTGRFPFPQYYLVEVPSQTFLGSKNVHLGQWAFQSLTKLQKQQDDKLKMLHICRAGSTRWMVH